MAFPKDQFIFATAIATIQTCLTDVQSWMKTNKLKLNPDKTEFILLGNKSQRERLAACFAVDILGSVISPSDKVRDLFCILIFPSRATLHRCVGLVLYVFVTSD